MPEMGEVRGEHEIQAVAALAAEIWNQHYLPIIGRAQVDYMLAKFQSPEAIAGQIAEGYSYFLLREGGSIAGYMAVVPRGEGPGMMLSKLYVLAEMRGRGLGRAMVDFAEELCRRDGAKRLWLTVNKNNADSIAAYGRMGFVNAGPVVTDIGGGFVMDDYVLEKSLG
jgi:GNAT superfamily N-acetyltransferase